MTEKETSELRGTIAALQTAVALAFANQARRAGGGNLDAAQGTLADLVGQLRASRPPASAVLEAGWNAAAAAGYARCVEAITALVEAITSRPLEDEGEAG